MLLAGSLSAMAQENTTNAGKTLKPVIVREKAQAPEGKDALRATTSTIGKGQQELARHSAVCDRRDREVDRRPQPGHGQRGAAPTPAESPFWPQKAAKKTFACAGFSLQATGDIFIDGMRDPAFYERDTFNLDRLEVLRGSASMLFGRGSTGGAVNQVSKQPRTIDENEVSATLGNHNYIRVTGDFNLADRRKRGLRINAMATKADSNGSGSSMDKKGIAATYRFGIGTADEFSAGLYDLQNDNGMNYGMPWIKPNASFNRERHHTIISKLTPMPTLAWPATQRRQRQTTGLPATPTAFRMTASSKPASARAAIPVTNALVLCVFANEQPTPPPAS
jgi:catecholate siderophore receptor